MVVVVGVRGEVLEVTDDVHMTVTAPQARRTHLFPRSRDKVIYAEPPSATRKRRSTNLGVAMKARPSWRLRLRLPMMLLLNKLLLPRIGSPVEAVILSGVRKPAIPSGVRRLPILSGALKVAILTGPPLLLSPPPPRTPRNLLSGLTAVPGTVKRKSQTIR